MNPSASGWIKKHFPVFIEEIAAKDFSEKQFYEKLQKIGFIYANSIKTITYTKGTQLQWTPEEVTKVNLFDALAFTYYDVIENASQQDCLESIIQFYAKLDKGNKFSFKILHFKSSKEDKLEKILQERIQTNESFLQKNFSNIITNALLYLDVLAYEKFLIEQNDTVRYVTNFEALLANVVFLAFQEKQIKDKYENLILKLLSSSLRYTKIEEAAIQDFEQLNFSEFTDPYEQRYILDLACITVYNDQALETNEYTFIHKLGKKLKLAEKEVETALQETLAFLKKHREEIAYFNSSNAIKHFYKNTNRMVRTLILRNKNRLLKELSESKELVMLLGKSTSKELNEEEKAKVKNQLLDICKTVPSLAIFILPGGSVLLPILIKFIPQLLPSAFNENLWEEPTKQNLNSPTKP